MYDKLNVGCTFWIFKMLYVAKHKKGTEAKVKMLTNNIIRTPELYNTLGYGFKINF